MPDEHEKTPLQRFLKALVLVAVILVMMAVIGIGLIVGFCGF